MKISTLTITVYTSHPYTPYNVLFLWCSFSVNNMINSWVRYFKLPSTNTQKVITTIVESMFYNKWSEFSGLLWEPALEWVWLTLWELCHIQGENLYGGLGKRGAVRESVGKSECRHILEPGWEPVMGPSYFSCCVAQIHILTSPPRWCKAFHVPLQCFWKPMIERSHWPEGWHM